MTAPKFKPDSAIFSGITGGIDTGVVVVSGTVVGVVTGDVVVSGTGVFVSTDEFHPFFPKHVSPFFALGESHVCITISSGSVGLHVRTNSAHHSKHILIGSHVLVDNPSSRPAVTHVTSYKIAMHDALFVKPIWSEVL